MSEWYEYHIESKDEMNIANALIQKGLASINQNQLILNLQSLEPLQFIDNSDTENIQHLTIGATNHFISYVYKWIPNDELAIEISKQFPEQILTVKRTYSGGFYDSIFYLQNGTYCNAIGKPITKAFSGLNQNCLVQKGNQYKISLPIGNNDSKWGVFYLPLENITYKTHITEERTTKYAITVMFTTDTIPVYFSGKKVQMNVEDVINKYFDANQKYSQEMHKLLKVKVPIFQTRRCGKDTNIYYIVPLPCPSEISSDKTISITIADYNMKRDGNYFIVTLGEFARLRNSHIKNDKGEQQDKLISNKDLFQYCTQLDSSYEIQTENEEEQEYEL